MDVFDPTEKVGLALLSDQTTSYAHGTNYPLGLDDCNIPALVCGVAIIPCRGPTEVNYAWCHTLVIGNKQRFGPKTTGGTRSLRTEFCQSETAAASRHKIITFI